MVKIIFLITLVFTGILGLVYFINSQNPTKSLKDIPTNLPQIQPTAQEPQPTTFLAPTKAPEQVGPASQSAQQSTSASQMLATKSATIKTTKGDISVSLYGASAPNTVYNFITKSKSGFYNELTFHRVEDWVVQGGDPLGNGTGGGKMMTEMNNLPFMAGSLGIARGSDIRVSNDSQFFITKKDSPWLNEQYTNFGMVKSGMDIVNKLEIGDKILKITIEN